MFLHVIGCNSKGNCHIIQNEFAAYILDLGVSFYDIKRVLDYDNIKVRGAVVTHAHGDHSKSIKNAARAMIKIYASKSTFESCGIPKYFNRRQFEFDDNGIWKFEENYFDDSDIDIKAIIRVEHDVETHAFHLKIPEVGHVLYITDCGYYPHASNVKADLIIIECNYIDSKIGDSSQDIRNQNFHMSLDDTIQAIQNNCKETTKVVLTHLSDRNSDEFLMWENVMERTGMQNVAVARDGLVLDVSKDAQWDISQCRKMRWFE